MCQPTHPWTRLARLACGRRVHEGCRGIAILGVFAYAKPLKVQVMFQQFGLDERAGGIGA
jgi:hypothetical protein